MGFYESIVVDTSHRAAVKPIFPTKRAMMNLAVIIHRNDERPAFFLQIGHDKTSMGKNPEIRIIEGIGIRED